MRYQLDKLHLAQIKPDGSKYFMFWCPGCDCAHGVEVPRWQWNGSMTAPTFNPSLLCNKDHPESRCHSFVRDGYMVFLQDCHHNLKDKTVEIPAWESVW